jgi:hypothetical protein
MGGVGLCGKDGAERPYLETVGWVLWVIFEWGTADIFWEGWGNVLGLQCSQKLVEIVRVSLGHPTQIIQTI